jgi:hypothetical protein
MAPKRHRNRVTSPIRIDSAAHAHLHALIAALEPEGLPGYINLIDAVSALVLFATPQQLAGMLGPYFRATGGLLGDDTSPPDDEV